MVWGRVGLGRRARLKLTTHVLHKVLCRPVMHITQAQKFKLEVSPTRRGMFHETKANHANLCLVVDCFRGEIHERQGHWSGRSARPDAPLEQRRPPLAPKKKTRSSQTQFSIPLCLPNHTSTNQVTTSLRSAIAISPSLLPAWGSGAALAHPRDPISDSLLDVAGKTTLPLAAAMQGERAPSLASFIANGCFLTSCVIRI